MKTPITGTARAVSDINERARKLFESHPMAVPTPVQRKSFNSSRKPAPPAAPAAPDEEAKET